MDNFSGYVIEHFIEFDKLHCVWDYFYVELL